MSTSEPMMVRVNEDGDEVDGRVLEEAGVAFNPLDAPLDLTKAEKRRTTALMMAIQAYSNLIVKDAAMYTTMVAGGKRLKEASIDAMVVAAMQFDAFIAGQYEGLKVIPETDGQGEETATEGSGT